MRVRVWASHPAWGYRRRVAMDSSMESSSLLPVLVVVPAAGQVSVCGRG